jgi:hypothetical protein
MQTVHEPTETITGEIETPKEGWSKCKKNKEMSIK